MGDVDTAPDCNVLAPARPTTPRNSLVARFGADRPLKLDAGVELSPFQIAYKTYGTLNAERTNAVLICHALTGDHHVASVQSGHRQARLVGDHGRPRQADRHRALFRHLPERASAPAWAPPGRPRPIPQTGKPWGLDFPVITIRDMVRAQAMLLDELEASTRCSRWPAARWAACRCCNGRRAIRERVFCALPIACATRHSAQNIAFHEVGRQAVMADPEWRQRPLSRRGHQPAARARGRAHGRAHHLSVGRRAASQVRPQVPGPRKSDVLVRRRLRGGSPICAIRAARSSSASTPTRISI